MPHHLSLYEPGQPLEFVHFPNTGMVSLVIATEDGKTVEVGEVGREGFAGIQAAVGINRNQVREIVQIAGDGFRVRIGALQSVLQSAPELQRILTRYAVVQGMQFAQTAACNRLHNIEQRLARWLLITQDRVDSPTLAITHDFLATMLGTDPELVLDQEFDSIPVVATIERDGKVHWTKTFRTGESEMYHSLQNIEHHHFKFEAHRRPGDVHVHFFGTDCLSFSDHIRLQDRDIMQVAAESYGRPLRNPVHADKSTPALISVVPLR